MKHLLLALSIPFVLAGCYERRPAVVQPSYVARCPAGYRYDCNDCHRIYARPHRVEVEVR